MRARDLAFPYPTVTVDTPAFEAARLLAGRDLPGLIVTDGDRQPVYVLSATEVLRLAVPPYCQEDPTLARVVDEGTADVFARELDGRTVGEVLTEPPSEPPVVTGEATMLEVAALMARTHSPLVAVVDSDGRMLGAVTLETLLDRVLGESA